MDMWHPALPQGPLPIYERLVLAMTQDVQSGRLAAGTRLPPQRELAFRLGVSVGSVTRAYAEAERRGLLSAHVGRGSFVRGRLPAVPDVPTAGHGARQGPLALQCNTPPPVPLMADLHVALTDLMAQGVLDPAVHYVQGSGLHSVRDAAAQWIERQFGLAFDAESLIQCNGGQHAIALVFSSFCAAGETVLCESSTFYGARMAADHLGLTLRGVRMDEEGLCPEALDRAAAETGSRLLFTLPTVHNPTTRTMSEQRRQEIATVARARDLLILEDDAYYAYSDRPRQIVTYAPERTLYIASLSKTVCPGLRLAFLSVPPTVARERLTRGIRALGYCPPALGALVFRQWVEDHRIDAIADAVQVEAAARWDIARDVLGSLMAPAAMIRSSLHVWLPMAALDAERMTAQLLREDIEVTPPSASIVSEDADTGIRLCLGAPPDRATLEQALVTVRATIAGQGSCSDGVI